MNSRRRRDERVPIRVRDRHEFDAWADGQRLRDAGVREEDRALLLGHAIEGMRRHHATATS